MVLVSQIPTLPFQHAIDLTGQSPVFFGDLATCGMRAELNTDFVVFIAPSWVVIAFFRQQGYPRHKGKCLAKIFELEVTRQRVVFFFPHNFEFK